MKNASLVFLTLFVSHLTAQEWSLFYTHQTEIQHFATSEYADHVAISDDEGLHLIYAEESSFFSNVTYQFMGKNYTADLSEIKDIRISENERVYVTTADSSILLFYYLEFLGGIPAYVIDGELSEITYWCLFEMRSEFQWPKPLYGAFDIEDGDVYVECEFYDCFEFPIVPSIFTYDRTAVFIDPLGIELLNFLNPSDQFLNHFDLNQMPFQQIQDAVIWNRVSYPQTEFRNKLHLWVNTENGLGLYRSEESAFDYDEWEEVSWELYNTENSALRTNEISNLQRIVEDSGPHEALLMGYNNDPSPVFYFIDGDNDPAICPFDNSNSPIVLNKDITDIYSNLRESVFIVQGNKVLELYFENFQCNMSVTGVMPYRNVTQNLFQNPVYNVILLNDNVAISNTYSLQIEVYNSNGVRIKSEEFDTYSSIDISNWSQGLYFVKLLSPYETITLEKIVKL